MTVLPETVQNLIRVYKAYEQELPVRESAPHLEELVRFAGNKAAPIHKWYSFKEGFSFKLLDWLCEALPFDLVLVQTRSILDPFCGVGTSLVSAQMAHRGPKPLRVCGVECNPFIRFVAEAKLAWPTYRLERIQKAMPTILATCSLRPLGAYPVPELSTIHNPKVFSPTLVQELLSCRDRIVAEFHGEPEERFFLLGWAAVIETVSGLRRDGRALRFKSNGEQPSLAEALENQWRSMLDDLLGLVSADVQPQSVEWRVLAGDGRSVEAEELGGGDFDLIVYSSPYLNNIDYTEVYKLELWLSGLVQTREAFRSLRLGTMRSHPSVRFPDTSLVDTLPDESWAKRLRSSLLEAIPQDEDLRWRGRLFSGYLDDMCQALTTQLRLARPSGPIVCVVGNSLHGRKEHPIPVATDLLICALAQEVGLKIEWLQIARQLRRRDGGNELLRESIILMRRP